MRRSVRRFERRMVGNEDYAKRGQPSTKNVRLGSQLEPLSAYPFHSPQADGPLSAPYRPRGGPRIRSGSPQSSRRYEATSMRIPGAASSQSTGVPWSERRWPRHLVGAKIHRRLRSEPIRSVTMRRRHHGVIDRSCTTPLPFPNNVTKPLLSQALIAVLLVNASIFVPGRVDCTCHSCRPDRGIS
jgi:hypothetical protein